MLIQALLVCLLANIYLVGSSDFVFSSGRLPKGVSIDQHNENIRKYWTLDRIKAAKSLDIKLSALPRGRSAAKTNLTTGPPSGVPGTVPTNSPALGRAISRIGRQVYTTGKVLFRSFGQDYICSGSIISSNTGDLVSTAGHCVYDEDYKIWYNSYWVFIPAYSNGNQPYGKWVARNFTTFTKWTNSGDFNYDVAFVALATLNNRHIQSVVGSQGIGFNFARLQYTYSFGYPWNINRGETRSSCVAKTQNPTGAGSAYHGQRLPCNMEGGSSGGPWLQNVNEANGVGYVTSLNSFGYDSLPNFMYGPYFGSSVRSLYDTATTM